MDTTPVESHPVRPLRAFGDTLRDALELYKKNANTYALIATIPFIFTGSLHAIKYFATDGFFSTIVLIGVSVIFVIIGAVLTIAYPLALTEGFIRAERGETLDPNSLFKAAFSRFWSYLWLSILVALVMLGGFSLFLIPGIILAVYIVPTLYVFWIDGKKSYDALAYSTWYVRGYFWDVLSRLILVCIAVIAASAVVSILVSVVTLPFHLGQDVARFTSELVQSLFIIPITMCFYYEIYKDLRAAKQGVEIDAAWISRSKKWSVVLTVVAFLVPVVVLCLWGVSSVGFFGK